MCLTSLFAGFSLAGALLLCPSLSASPLVLQAPVETEQESTTDDELRVLDAGYHHLGDDEVPEWTEASAEPEGNLWTLSFESEANSGEWCLLLQQRDVDDNWRMTLNDVDIGPLTRYKAVREVAYAVPAGVCVDGVNVLVIESLSGTDDITFGNLRVAQASVRDALGLRPVRIEVTDADTGAPSPARVTIVRRGSGRAQIFGDPGALTAVRDGIVYLIGDATIELQAGEYALYASRGTEWSMDQVELTLGADELEAAGEESGERGDAGIPTPRQVSLSLRREVDTTGYVACDTHVHTLTYSGHGDASVPERLVTLAGEGVELAIATDHNHHTDYRPLQHELGLDPYYTSVVGNEVTTDNGHFNAFPLDPDGELPPWQLTDWVALVQGMRDAGARAIVLNHPRWPSIESGPYAVFGLDPFTGARATATPFHFDAMELVNSSESHADPYMLFRDWFALLNRGESIVAVGSSDSHTVGAVVGQGRTYVPSPSDDPAAIDVDAASDLIAAGRTTISLGLIADVRVDGSYAVGDLVPLRGASAQGGASDGPLGNGAGPVATLPATLPVALRVAAPSWVTAREARVFLNGEAVAVRELPASEGQPLDTWLEFELPIAHAHDQWLVCVVTGDEVTGPWWPMKAPFTLAATNPVYLDVDGDGVYTHPRETARRLLDGRLATGTALEHLSMPPACDDAVAIQFVDQLYERLQERARRTAVRIGFERGLRRPDAAVGANPGGDDPEWDDSEWDDDRWRRYLRALSSGGR